MDNSKNFSFKWANFEKSISYSFSQYLESGKFTDCSLSTERKFIQAHKIILSGKKTKTQLNNVLDLNLSSLSSACSAYFEQIFDGNNDGKMHVIVLNEIALEDLVSILQFAYKGETTIKRENYQRFFKAAEYLQIKGILSDQQDIPVVAPPTPPQETALADISLESGIMDAICSVKSEIMSPKADEGLEPLKKNLKRKMESLGQFALAVSTYHMS